MELWVRSQDKEKLLKVDEIHLGLGKEYKLNVIWVNNWIVGEYKQKERALEVLDEIQRTLEVCQQSINEKNLHFTNNDDCTFNISVGTQQTLIYEMPSE